MHSEQGDREVESGDIERRTIRRVMLGEPIAAFVGHVQAMVLDLSPAAVGISHHSELGPAGSTVFLRFTWRGRGVYLRCAIIRSDIQRVGSAAYAHTLRHSALQIVSTIGDADEVLRAIVAESQP